MAALWNRAGHYSFALRFLSFFFLLMAALRSRSGHYIFAMWFLLSLLSIFFTFLALSQQSQIGRVPNSCTRCGPSANL